MRTITKQTAIRWVKQQLKHGQVNQLILLTFKKDRQVRICLQDQGYTLIEAGYQHQTFTNLDQQAVIKLLKQLLATEFPRSHTIYVQINE